MRTGAYQSQRVETSVRLRVDPRVVQSSQILQLTRHELEAAIEIELNDNPALERVDDGEDESVSDESILKQVAPQELKQSLEDTESWRCAQHDGGEAVDWVDLAAGGISLEDHLEAQLLPMLEPEFSQLGRVLIGSLNERGYLGLPIEEVALTANCSLEDAMKALKVLHECEPPGIGAQCLQECLAIQLRGVQGIEGKLARAIIKNCMDDLAAKRFAKIAKRFEVEDDLLEEALELIRELNPFPGSEFQMHRSSAQQLVSQSVAPDIVISRDESGWKVEVRGADPATLGIDRYYQRQYREAVQADKALDDAAKHVTTYVRRAADFIKSIAQRRVTMRKIGDYLITKQPGFLSTGKFEFLNALTRSQMANELGLHESTVSRATQSKFVQIPTGEVVAFEVFFKPALRVQKMIEEILAMENPDDPLSDEQISKILHAKGVEVARRTVNKYRDKTKLLSSHRRKG